MRVPPLLLVLPFLSTIGALAVPLAGLSGEENPDTITDYLLFSHTGNTGSNPDRTSAGTGYWTSAAMTSGDSSSSNIHSTLTFTATGLSPGESIDITGLSFDYIRTVLNGSFPKMNVYVDSGAGYGPSVLLVDDSPATTYQLDPQSISTFVSLEEGDSVTFGFSFEDIHGLPQRTHLIDNVVLNGTFDLLSAVPGIDLNQNGVSDVWEYRFSASHLVSDDQSKQADYDGDGLSNFDEATAGTNPFDPASNIAASIEPESATEAMVKMPTSSGKGYTLWGSETLTEDSWTPLYPEMEGSGGELGLIVDHGSLDRYFYRFELSDIDADSDRLTRWEEQHIEGFSDDANPSDDYGLAKAMVQSALDSSILITTSDVPVIGTDLFTTILDITDLEAPKDRTIDGVSMLPAFEGKPLERPIPLFWRTHVSPPGDRVAMRIGDWKIVGDETLTHFQLFNIQKDWQEKNDLAAEMPEKADEMKTTLLKLWQEIEAEGPSEWWKEGRQQKPKGGGKVSY